MSIHLPARSDRSRAEPRLHDSVRRSLNWLVASQQPDGSWPDFIVSPTTEGREWTTGFVGAHLAELPHCSRGAGRALLERSWAFLRDRRRPGGGWGFWAGSPVDADSTSWCLLSLLAAEGPTPDDFDRERVLLRSHLVGQDGGCATYRRHNAPMYPTGSGYFAATPCVSAAVGLALLRLGHAADRESVERIHGYLLSTRREDGSWPSFWWERRIYSTVMAVRFFLAYGHSAAELAPAVEWLSSLQAADGSWWGERHARPNAFLTAMAVSTLVAQGLDRWQAAVGRGIQWLLGAQELDGTWPCPPIMKVPPPEEAWSEDQDSGGVIVQSHRRNFVTAAIVGVLGRFPEASLPSGERLPEIHLHDPELEREVEDVVRLFDSEVAKLPASLLQIARLAPEWHRRGTGLSHYLPFWLDAWLTGGRMRGGAARTMALANRYGQLFCLLQDGVIDGDVDASPAVLIPIDSLFLRFVRGYQALFPAPHPFWEYFDRYWHEYLEALAREKRRRTGRFGPEDHSWLGKKFSPVKICAAGFALLADRADLIDVLERCIDDLQTGFQLLDDLRDARRDLDHGHGTWPLALLGELRGGDLPAPEAAEDILWAEGVARRVLERATNCFAEAGATAEALGLQGMCSWVRQLLEYVRNVTAELSAPPVFPRRDLHVFYDADRQVVFNGTSGLLSAVDPEVAALARKLARGGTPETADEASILKMLDESGMLSSAPPGLQSHQAGLSVLFLGAHAGCGHRCVACPAWAHSESPSSERLALDQGLRAVEFLLRDGPETGLRHLVFLDPGGALPWPLVDGLMESGKRKAEEKGRRLTFHAVLGPAAPDVEVLRALSESGGTLLLRRDGVNAEAQLKPLFDRIDQLARAGVTQIGVNVGLQNYGGSPTRLVAELERPGVSAIGIQSRRTCVRDVRLPRLDVEATQADFQALVDHFATQVESGHNVPLFDVLHPLRQLQERRRVSSPCGAASRSLAVNVGGELLPCFRLADRPALVVGDLEGGAHVERLEPYARSVDDREPCRSCWARYLCGGGCHVGHLERNGDIRRPDADECRLITHRYRVILLLAARLGDYFPSLSKAADQSRFVTFQV